MVKVKSQEKEEPKKGKEYSYKTIVALVIVSLLLIGSFIFVSLNESKYARNKRQAVFATNGIVYFGYIKGERSDSITLEDIYYISYQNILAPTDNNKLTLIKNGDEVYGPENKMELFKNQIIYVQPMKDNSKINDAIKDYISKNKK